MKQAKDQYFDILCLKTAYFYISTLHINWNQTKELKLCEAQEL